MFDELRKKISNVVKGFIKKEEKENKGRGSRAEDRCTGTPCPKGKEGRERVRG